MKDLAYNVLLLSSSSTFHAVLKSLLPPSNYPSVCSAYSVRTAKEFLNEQQFDLILVDTPLADASGKLFALEACRKKGTVVLLFIKQELFDEVNDEVIEHGIFTLAKPTSRSIITQALKWMGSAREHLRLSENETHLNEQKIDDIRMVNRAKWLLISELKMNETDAHHYIEKQAMDRCLSKRQIAEDIIRMYSL